MDEPVTRLDVRLVSGRLNVVHRWPGAGRRHRIGRRPLLVEMRDGRLTVAARAVDPVAGGCSGPSARSTAGIAPRCRSPCRPRSSPTCTWWTGTLVASGLRGDTKVDVTSGQVTLARAAGAHQRQGHLRAGRGARHRRRPRPGDGLRRADPRRQRAPSGSAPTPSPARSPATWTTRDGSEIRLSAISGSITVAGPRGQRPHRAPAPQLRQHHQRLPPGGRPLKRALGPIKDSHGVLGAGEGRLWASATSGSIALLARPVATAEDVEELP